LTLDVDFGVKFSILIMFLHVTDSVTSLLLPTISVIKGSSND